MPSELEENHRSVRRYFDLLNGSDLSKLEEVVSPDVVFFGPCTPEGIRGREAFIGFVATLRRDSPDLYFTGGEMVVERNRAGEYESLGQRPSVSSLPFSFGEGNTPLTLEVPRYLLVALRHLIDLAGIHELLKEFGFLPCRKITFIEDPKPLLQVL